MRKKTDETIHTIGHFYAIGKKPDALVITIPVEVRQFLKLKPKQKVYVKTDERGRIILERLE